MLPEHKWEIGISAGSYYPSLTQEFWGNDIGLSYENDHLGMQFFGYSYHIDELDEEHEVASRLFTLQILLNGCLRVAWEEIFACPVEFVEFSRCDGGGRSEVYASKIEDFPFSLNPKIDQNQWDMRPASGRLHSYLLWLSKKDAALRAILIQIGLISLHGAFQRIMTWGTLYKIYDSVKYHSKVNDYPVEKFADEKRLNAFTAACNNSLLLGPNARHGDKGWGVPSSSITDIDEAANLVLEFASNFIRCYVRNKYPLTSA